MRMREPALFLLPIWNLTSPLCSWAPISHKTRVFRRFGHKWLRCSTSPELTAIAFVNGKWQFSTPTESTPLNGSQNICHSCLRWQPLLLCQICCTSVHGRILSEEWNITKILLFILFVFCLFVCLLDYLFLYYGSRCCHSNATRALFANPPNSAQLGASPTTTASYIRVRA